MKLKPDQIDKLITKAWEVRERAYTPYFKFPVGCALQTEDGTIYAGCNVENSSASVTLCAEASAVGSAISAGKKKFVAAAIVGPENDYVYPCGVCRQRFSEFSPKMEIILASKKDKKVLQFPLDELFPHAFGLPHG